MKIIIILLLILIFYIARILSMHHENALFKFFYKFKLKFLGNIFVGKHPLTRFKVDKSKISVMGLISHGLCLCALIFCIYMLIFYPIIDMDVILAEGAQRGGKSGFPIIASTLNEACSFIACQSVLLFEFIILFLEGLKTAYNTTTDTASNSMIAIEIILNFLLAVLFTIMFSNSLVHLIDLLFS